MHKTKMYACIVFFPNGDVKRWKYVRDLHSFSLFLGREHSTWNYFNVYAKGDRQFLKRFYPNNLIPKILSVFVLVACLTFLKTFNGGEGVTYEKTFEKTTFTKATFNNGFNISATISNSEFEKGGVQWL